MTWDEVIKIAWTAVGGVASIGIIIGATVKFSADRIAERLASKYELKLNKELEYFKSGLDRKNYISKVRFDAEFALYRELTEACRNMVDSVYMVYPTYADVPAGESERAKYEDENFKKAQAFTNEFVKIMTSNSPFIPKAFCTSFMELIKLCRLNLDVYAERWNKGYLGVWEGSEDKRHAEREAYLRTSDITEKFEKLIDDIRDYLMQLDVNE